MVGPFDLLNQAWVSFRANVLVAIFFLTVKRESNKRVQTRYLRVKDRLGTGSNGTLNLPLFALRPSFLVSGDAKKR